MCFYEDDSPRVVYEIKNIHLAIICIKPVTGQSSSPRSNALMETGLKGARSLRSSHIIN